MGAATFVQSIGSRGKKVTETLLDHVFNGLVHVAVT